MQVEYLRKVERHANGMKLIVGMDANACSSYWHSKSHTNDQRAVRGRAFEEWIDSNGMLVLNRPSYRYTYNGASCNSSDIDVTLRSASGWGDIKSRWEILDVGTSDHNALQTTCGFDLDVAWDALCFGEEASPLPRNTHNAYKMKEYDGGRQMSTGHCTRA